MPPMDELIKRLSATEAVIRDATKQIGLPGLEKELEKLQEDAKAADFWSDNLKAQDSMKRQAKLQVMVEPWQKLEAELKDVKDLLELKDPSLEQDLAHQLDSIERTFGELKENLKFWGKYDDHDAILSIYAGAGGTDAQDWAGMLLRMYVRWAEKHKFSVKMIDESAGEEAGLKSATLQIEGDFAYGKLKGEHGVHRLVRLSPFNADNLRQTSFAKVEILPSIDRPEEVSVDEKDLKIDVFRAGGHGGQSVNTTDSAVRVTHISTGITVAIQNERSQLQNKETALTILRSRLAQLQMEQHQERVSELKGPNQSAEWGNQIRSYVLHPYKQVKDLRTKYESSDPDSVLDGNLDGFIESYLEHTLQ